MVDHVSDSFLETNVPLLVLIEAAKAGDEKGVEEYAAVFADHANKLVEVANLACSMSSNEEGVKMVRMAAAEIETLCPQVSKLFCQGKLTLTQFRLRLFISTKNAVIQLTLVISTSLISNTCLYRSENLVPA